MARMIKSIKLIKYIVGVVFNICEQDLLFHYR